ncbi:ImmA/IrrE family metallo-endopeptidase [Sporolactobacillus shoreae]|uniref:ImmA/IrrE family metallo-endopeptidase n=1 Tax=Sporolactobacillus shoreae TaxID=1465501 RepID=A0A4Z0GIY5_9BACL|nr:ImmA/IrrE family metallo-endopeptidase [Sporolactobacillus shoreae]TGA96719.1 ImmA/IrrE family metallo-endopeptidase [Sporolactobacillus shoreae]
MEWILAMLLKTIRRYKTVDPFEVAKAKHILIRYLPLGETYGFYLKNARQQVIHINSDMEDYKRPFICSHELGHAILHPNANTPFLDKRTLISKGKIESQANAWSTAQILLLNHARLSEYETSQQLLRMNGIPLEMERFINSLPDRLF